MRAFLVALLVGMTAISTVAKAAADLGSPVGLWEAVDEGNGKPKGRMRIYLQGDVFFGRNEPLRTSGEQGRLCSRCSDERKDQPLMGLLIMRNMRSSKGEYSGGDILDPSTGRVYQCKFHLAEDGHKLVLRGFLGITLLGGTQVWRRVE